MPIKNIQSSIMNIFEFQESDKSALHTISKKLADEHIEYLRTNLEFSAKKCGIYVFLMDHFDNELNKVTIINTQSSNDDYSIDKWRSILKIHKGIYDLIGYLTLLQMDAMTTCISLFHTTTDTERIMLCKHSYTIIYEALEHNLFKKVAQDMHQYPEKLVAKEKIKKLWKSIKEDIKKITEKNEAKQVRNSIDAHKSASFMEQINTYKQCKWTQSIINLYLLIKIIENIQNSVEKINTNMKKLYDQYRIMMEEHIKQLDNIHKILQQPDKTFIASK